MTTNLGKFSLAIALLTLFAATLGFQQSARAPFKGTGFTRVGSLPASAGNSHLQFVDSQRGWLFSVKGLWHTRDAGKSWEAISLPVSGTSQESFIQEAYFFDAESGWIRRDEEILTTEDRGRTWSSLPPLPGGEPDGEVDGVWFEPSCKLGWVAGGVYRPAPPGFQGAANNAMRKDDAGHLLVLQAVVYRTSNGGHSWQPELLAGVPYRAYSVSFRSAEDGFVLASGSAFKSKTGGREWSKIQFGKSCTDRAFYKAGGDPKAICSLGARYAWLSFENGYLFHTSDGGTSWCQLIAPCKIWSTFGHAQTYFRDLHFTSERRGWAIETFGALYTTQDGGSNWLVVETKDRVRSMSFVDEHHGWMITDNALYQILQ